MRILSINTYDIGGGAEKIAQTLHLGYKSAGHFSHLAVGSKRDPNGDAIVIPNDEHRSSYARVFISIANSLAPLGLGATRNKIKWFGQRARKRAIGRGEEDFDYPGTKHILDGLPLLPDIVHCHNLHGGYFDLRYLAELSKHVKVVVTLHDEWIMTGHCAYTLGCKRWNIGCGECPDLSIYPAVKCDATHYNWERKKDIFSRSQLFIATPSKWLMDNVKQSVLAPAIVDSRIIHNGVDLNVFKPADKQGVRSKLGISNHAKVLLFTANGIKNNKFKDFATLREAIGLVATRLPEVDLQFLALGDKAQPMQIGKATITFVPYSSDPCFVAAHCQAADVYLHAANSEVWGLTITEALACGTPVVATSVGGIPEQIEHGITGFLVPPKDPESMADRICELLTDDTRLERMKFASAEYAKLHLDQNMMVDEYLKWHNDILNGSIN